MSTYRTHRIVVASLFLPHTAVLGESAPTPSRSPSSPPGSLSSKLSGVGPKGIVEALQDAARPTPSATPGQIERSGSSGFFAPTTPGTSDSVASTAVSGFANALAAAGSAASNAASAVAGAIPMAGVTATASTPAATPAGENVPILRPKMLGPLKSIVEDLQDKSRNVTPQPTPGVELINPFSTPLPTRQQGATSPPHHGPSRLTRKSTLAARAMSKSRSYTSDSLSPGSPELASGQLWHVEPNSAANGGLHNAINSVKERLKDVLWVGTLGTATDSFDHPTRASVDAQLRTSYSSLPVWIPDAEFRAFYDEFCHQVLWPALHYAVPDAPKTKSFFESSAWREYVAVNTRFAEMIAKEWKEGDVIFVNDYHLLLLPQLLRERLPTATIGFFLHVAFPSSEIFRCLAVRGKLLKGMLGADLLGFQTANHARHFRQTVSRILSLEATPRGIQGEERFVDVGVFPMGIDVGSITARRNEPEVKEWIETLQQRYAGFKLLVGRDKLDEVQGVKHKLLAFELFLERYPEFQGKVVLIQVALQTTEQNESQSSVGSIVSRINGRFASLTYTPVVFLHTHDLTFAQYLALLTVADAFVVTSVREGMALRAHEFVECQADRKRPLILSEFTGSYTYRGFRSCIAINPWDKRGTATAMHQALTMSQSEAESRWEDLHAHVTAQSAQTFVHGFLQRTLRASAEHVRSGEAEGPAGGPPRIDVGSVLPRWKHSDRRFVGVDLEGTIWRNRDPRDASARPDAKVIDALKKLSENGKNAVWIFSGLPIQGALEELGQQVPRAGIVAENGCFIRPPAEEGGEEEGWMSMVESKNLDWKGPCLEILHYFTERTPGAYVEERKASVVWRYWTQWDAGAGPAADRAWARRQAAEAQNHIFDSIGERFGLRIVPGANSFLVLPSDVSRATAFSTILDPGGPVQNPRLRALHTVTSNTPSSPGGITDSPGPGNLLRKPRRQSSSRIVRGEEAAFDVLLVLSQDERLLRRVGEQEGAETVSVNVPDGHRATEARWSVGVEEALSVLEGFAGVGA